MPIRSRTRQVLLLLFVLAALLTGVLGIASSATANPSIEAKRAQAQAILGQIQEMDSQLERAIEAYNYANVQLDQIDGDLVANAGHLKVARRSLGVAQRHIAARLKGLYINGDGGGAIEVILGASSLDDLLSRLDVATACRRERGGRTTAGRRRPPRAVAGRAQPGRPAARHQQPSAP